MTLAVQKVAGALSVLAAFLFLLATLALPWWEARGGGSIDLRTIELCLSSGCRAQSLAQAGGAQSWSLLGIAAYSTGLVSSILLLAGAGLAALGRPVPSALSWVGAALSGFGAIMALGFVMIRPPPFDGLAPAYGMACFFAAAGLGLVSALALARR